MFNFSRVINTVQQSSFFFETSNVSHDVTDMALNFLFRGFFDADLMRERLLLKEGHEFRKHLDYFCKNFLMNKHTKQLKINPPEVSLIDSRNLDLL